MASKYRSKQSYARKVNDKESYLLVVAVEGECTEKQYFEYLQNSRLKIVPLPSIDGKTSPKFVFENLKNYSEKNHLYDDDLKWILIDKDRWSASEISDVISKSNQANFSIAVSNPCFEVWLVLHHTSDLSNIVSSEDAKRKLKSLRNGSYNSSNCPKFKDEEIKLAIENSRTLASCQQLFPTEVGTMIYKLAEEVMRLRS